MEAAGIKFEFIGKPWLYAGASSWTFISLPNAIATEIRDNLKSEEQGWGRLKVTAQIGKTTWATAIWFDTKMNTYLLPLKSEIRKKEGIDIDKKLKVLISI